MNLSAVLTPLPVLIPTLAAAVTLFAGRTPRLQRSIAVAALSAVVAVGTGVAAMLLGGEFLQSALLDLHLPVFGHVHFVTSVFFDVGVYLIVVGLVLDVLRSLGARVDVEMAQLSPAAR